MRRWSLRTVALLAMAGSPAAARAADAVPTDGKTCFCLRHVGSGAISTGCHAAQGTFYPRAICWDERAQKSGDPFTLDDRWALIKDGDDRCQPCDRRPARQGFEPLRTSE